MFIFILFNYFVYLHMGYDKTDLENKAILAIKKNGLVFFDEIHSRLGVSAATLYNHELEKLETIKESLTQNRISIKQALRKNWTDKTASANLQIAHYKLLADDFELKRLTNYESIHKHEGEINHRHEHSNVTLEKKVSEIPWEQLDKKHQDLLFEIGFAKQEQKLLKKQLDE